MTIIAKASLSTGKCKDCRHSNINNGTSDAKEGLLACYFAMSKSNEQECDDKVANPESNEEYFLFEPFNGKNATWGSKEEIVVK